mmetsp:Transcript_54019/g.108527  ORF Transcript_54019/g.108527 Transcript_54019/m.108527 type:complete len:282 (-) Transcript_54019:76-921(-)
MVMAGAARGADVKVIGAGLSRTGTQSLQLALDQLGYKTLHGGQAAWNSRHFRWAWDFFLHYNGSLEPALQGLAYLNVTAVVDQPFSNAYRELSLRFPEAKVILTVRDTAEKWVSSFDLISRGWTELGECRRSFWCRLTTRVATDVSLAEYGEIADFDVAHKKLLGCDLLKDLEHDRLSRRECMSAYLRHNDQVKEAVPPSRLLIFNVKEGWGPLCRFLGVPVLDVPFPRGDDIRGGTVVHPTTDSNHDFRVGLFCLLLISCIFCRCARRGCSAVRRHTKED